MLSLNTYICSVVSSPFSRVSSSSSSYWSESVGEFDSSSWPPANFDVCDGMSDGVR